jgi:hypothetical protein
VKSVDDLWGNPDMNSACLAIGRLREVFPQSRFETSEDAHLALSHFGRSCPICWRHLAEIVEDDLEINPEALERAIQATHRPPIALALGRLILAARQPDTAAALPPTHRRLLRRESWGQGFNFRWLLVQEVRRLVLSGSGPPIDRWRALLGALNQSTSGNSELDQELQLLIEAYQADELRDLGQAQTREAEDLLARLLSEPVGQALVARCRPEIRATIYEMAQWP